MYVAGVGRRVNVQRDNLVRPGTNENIMSVSKVGLSRSERRRRLANTHVPPPRAGSEPPYRQAQHRYETRISS